jgi:hypothetical protein
LIGLERHRGEIALRELADAIEKNRNLRELLSF